MSLQSEPEVLELAPADAPRVAEVLTEAFAHYPVMRFVFGDAADLLALRKAVDFFVAARVHRNEPLLGIADGDGRGLAAAAIVTIPDGRESPPAVAAHREALWAEVGADVRARYEACGKVWERFSVDVPHIHLNMIGVRAAHRGRGLGRVILEHVQGIARRTPRVQGVTLTTEDPANVPLYQHLGYEVVDHGRIAPGLETWWMFRRS